MRRPNRRTTIIYVGAIGAALLIAHLIERGAPQPSEGAQEKPADTLAAAEMTAVMLGEAELRASLKDPASAEFEGVFGRVKHGLHVACGEVNAKNSFGAYAGASFFVAEVETGEVIIQSLQTERRFQGAWARYCQGRSDAAPAPPTELFGVRWGERIAQAPLKPYGHWGQIRVFRGASPSRYLGVAIKSVIYESDKGRIFGGDVSAEGEEAYDQLKAALIQSYGQPTSQIGATRYAAWDWGKGSGLIQLTWSPRSSEAGVHLERQR